MKSMITVSWTAKGVRKIQNGKYGKDKLNLYKIPLYVLT